MIAAIFTGDITLGSLLAIATIIVAVFTVRDKVRSGWKANYETVTEELTLANAELLRQRERAHGYQSELAAERMKTDLSGLMKVLADQHSQMLRELGAARQESVSAMTRAVEDFEGRVVPQLAAISTSQAMLAATMERIAMGLGVNGH